MSVILEIDKNGLETIFKRDKIMIHKGEIVYLTPEEFEQMIEYYNTYKKMKEIDCE